LRNQRLLLEARALSDLGRHEVGLEVIADIPGAETTRLRADILWAAKRWRAAAEQIELNYGDRWREFAPLADGERHDILRAAVGYVLGEDPIGLERFREKYSSKMADGPERRAFDIISRPVEVNSAEFRDIARAIAAVDTLADFIRELRERHPAHPELSAPPSADAPVAPQTRKAEPPTTGTTPRREVTDPAAASPLPPNPTTAPRPTKSRTAAR
jgi:hypothetical protein